MVRAVLASGDGGLVSHFTGTGAYAEGPLSRLAPARRERWLDAMRPIEPIRWIGRADAPILFLSGRNDELVPPADARKYQHAARTCAGTTQATFSPPKECAMRHGGSRRGSASPRRTERGQPRCGSAPVEVRAQVVRPCGIGRPAQMAAGGRLRTCLCLAGFRLETERASQWPRDSGSDPGQLDGMGNSAHNILLRLADVMPGTEHETGTAIAPAATLRAVRLSPTRVTIISSFPKGALLHDRPPR